MKTASSSVILLSIAILPLIASVNLFAEQAMEPKLAIMDFEYKGVYRFDDGTDAFIDMLTTAFVKTRKFKLVERSRIKDSLKEMGLGEAGVVDPEDCQKLGSLVKADFLVIGAITDATLNEKIIELEGLTTTKQEMKMSVDMRVVDAKTGDIKTAETITETVVKSKGVHIDGAISSVKNTCGIESDILRKVANSVVREMASNIYPVTIKNIKGNKVHLDYGAPVVEPNTAYEVMGSDGFKVGRIEVEDVGSRKSVASIVEGKGGIQIGMTCKFAGKITKATPAKKEIPW